MSSFERLLARALRQPAAAGTACPTAETLAAYFEGSLGRAEHGRVEHHASTCARCAAHLAALVQLSDRLDSPPEPRVAWSHRWRWLAPAAACVVTAAVWIALPRERVADLTRPAVPSSPSVPASAAAQPSPVPFAAQRQQETATAPAAPRLDVPSAKLPRAAVPSSDAAAERKGDVRERAEDKPTAQMARRAPAEADGGMNDRLQRADASPGARENAAVAEAPAVPPTAKDAFKKEQPVTAPAPAPATPPPAAQPAPEAQSAGVAALASRAEGSLDTEVRLKAARGPLVVSTPQQERTWRTEAGRVERSDDKGQSWVREEAPLLRAPIAGSAPSLDACWIVDAHAGILRRDADASWHSVTAPAATTAIIGVDARSGQAATVWTSSGQRFATSDGGAHWQLLPR